MESKLKTWSIKASDLLLIAWIFFAIIVANSYVAKFLINVLGDTTLANLLYSMTMQVMFLAYALAVNFYFKFELLKPVLGVKALFAKAFKYLFLVIVCVFCINIITNVFAYLFGYELEVQAAIDLWLRTDGLLEKTLAFVPTVIIAPIAEELIFRGLLFRLLKTRVSMILAMLASSFVFALIHFSIFAFLPLFLFAILLCFLYEKFGDLRLCILLHCLFNLFNTILLLICLSGQSL